MSNKLKLRYFRSPNSKYNNFGDELSPFIVSKVSGLEVVPADNKPTLASIGSILQLTRPGDTIWGTGLRSFGNPLPHKNLNVCSIRGPITYTYLSEKLNKDIPQKFGDPALLLPKFYKPNILPELNEKIGFVMHMSKTQPLHDLDDRFHIINPLSPWESVVDQIYSCNRIVSRGLHGIIVSDAYSIPSWWLTKPQLSEGKLKFWDYGLSQQKILSQVENINDVLKSNSPDTSTSIDPQSIIDSFPEKFKKNNTTI